MGLHLELVGEERSWHLNLQDLLLKCENNSFKAAASVPLCDAIHKEGLISFPGTSQCSVQAGGMGSKEQTREGFTRERCPENPPGCRERSERGLMLSSCPAARAGGSPGEEQCGSDGQGFARSLWGQLVTTGMCCVLPHHPPASARALPLVEGSETSTPPAVLLGCE